MDYRGIECKIIVRLKIKLEASKQGHGWGGAAAGKGHNPISLVGGSGWESWRSRVHEGKGHGPAA